MIGSWGILARALVVAGAIFVASCGTPQRPQVEPSIPKDKAAEMFAFGFAQIARSYLEDIDIGPLALEGLRGLSSLDPEFTASELEGRLKVRRDDQLIADLPMPGPREVAGWASLVADVASIGSRHSTEIRAAGAEGVYEAVFDGMLARLDGFSRYTGRRGAERNRARRAGFDGIGIDLRMVPRGAQIVGVTPDTPAAHAGLRKDDTITAIDYQPIANEDIDDVKDRLRGPRGSVVDLAIERDHAPEPAVYRIERQHVLDPTVFSEIENGVLVLTINGFNGSYRTDGTARAVREAVLGARFTRTGDLLGIVLDLRGNAGGLLKQAVQVADLFLSGGLIVSTIGRDPESTRYYPADSRDIAMGLPIVVVVDGKTASAAEILAAALQDDGRAVVVGTTTYGKGSVQTIVQMPNDGEMTLTWSRFVTPAGTVLHRLGVHPSICTSGVTGDDPLPLLEPVDMPVRAAATLRAWHQVRPEDTEGRVTLRRACPAEPRAGTIELRLARRLIEEITLYRRFVIPPEASRTASAGGLESVGSPGRHPAPASP